MRRKIGEEALREKKPAAADVIEGMIDAVVITDLDGKIVQFNKALTENFGWGKEVIGELPTIWVAEQDISKVMDGIKECSEKGSLRNFECIGLTKDKKEVPILLNLTLIKDPEGNPTNLIAVARDITELKRAEEERAKAAAEARAKLERAYKELAVLERTRTFASILFKDVFECLLKECSRRTIGKVRDQVRDLGRRLPFANGVRIGYDGSVALDDVLIRETLGGKTHEEATSEVNSAFSKIMDACDPIIRADIGDEKVAATASRAFSSLFKRPEVSTYRPDLVRLVPDGVEIPREYILLEPRRSYLVEERKPVHAFRIFSEAVRYGSNGLCVTTMHPDDAKREYGLGGASVIWLSKHEGISPASLEFLRDTITGFIEKTENTIVILDGLEYLITTNGFDLTMKFLYDLMESVTLNRSRLIVPVSPVALDARQLALLERHMEPIEIVEE